MQTTHLRGHGASARFLVISLILTLAGLPVSQIKAQKEFVSRKGIGGSDLISNITAPLSDPFDTTAKHRSGSKVGREATPESAIAAAVENSESEPNNTTGTADAITATQVRMNGNLFPNGDIDFYSFSATAGDRVYAATMTAFSAGSSTDSQITILAPDGTTVVEFDDDNGSFAGLSSSIAGATITSTGTYFIRVNDFTAGTTSERPYELWFSLQSSAPTLEVEPNDTPATANALPVSGVVSGARNPAAATEQDWYSMTLAAGDTVYLSLDLDPEDDLTTWNGRLGIALFGDANNQILVVDDAGAAEGANPLRPSEALFLTVKDAGTYFAFVDSASAAAGGPTATYTLNVTVLPRITTGLTCTVYPSADVPKTIGPGAGLVSSVLTVPGNPRISTMRVFIDATHALMQDMDVHLRSPAANDNGLFTDIGAAAIGGQTLMNLFLDDRAGIPPSFTVMRPIGYKPELAYRLGWFSGEDAGGTWTLDIRDDGANTSGGTLNNWSLEVCTEPPPIGQVLYSENFNANDGGYTHSGTADEWAWGVPNTAATTTTNPVAAFLDCNGTSAGCWKTDLVNTYNVSSNQDLFSPNLNLTAFSGTIQLEWAMRYQMESANFDHAFVEVQDVNNAANNRIVWQFLDATMTNGPGNPVVNIGESAGWGLYKANISDFAGRLVRLRFHLDSDSSINLGGLAIDDVVIRGLGVVAAPVVVSGRVTDAKGNAIARTYVSLTGSNGITRIARTNTFGYYRFDQVPVGENYLLDARAKGYTFVPRIVTVNDDVSDADMIALE